VALVLGILGILGGLVTVGVLGLLLGIPAIVLGVVGRRKVKQGRTIQHGGLAIGGLVTGIISTVLGTIFVVLLVIGIVFLSSNSGFQEEIERQQKELQER
jgi:uncharacterized membrane protein